MNACRYTPFPGGSGFRRLPGALVSLALLGGVAACSGDDDGGTTTTVTDRITETVTHTVPASDAADEPAPTTAPGTDPGTGSLTGDGSIGAQLTITEVRTGSHSGYDRVVLEFSGSGVPGYSLTLTDSPIADGSGFPIEYTGEQALVITATGMAIPEGATRVVGAPTGVIGSVEAMGVFEGAQLIVVGLTDPDITLADITTGSLSDPTRLVFDISR